MQSGMTQTKVSPGFLGGSGYLNSHTEQRDPQGRQEAQAVSVGRFGQEGRVPGDYGCVKKVDHADPELEGSIEPVYH